MELLFSCCLDSRLRGGRICLKSIFTKQARWVIARVRRRKAKEEQSQNLPLEFEGRPRIVQKITVAYFHSILSCIF